MREAEETTLEEKSVRMAMDQAWRDHQHTRDQTWKALQMEFLFAAGLIGVTWQTENRYVLIIAGMLIIVLTACGIQITLRHRNKVELLKFRHILNCEEFLGLHRDDLICSVKMPAPISFGDVFRLREGNTALFILRMHVAIMVFSLLYSAWNISSLTCIEQLIGYMLLACLVVFLLKMCTTQTTEKDDKKEYDLTNNAGATAKENSVDNADSH